MVPCAVVRGRPTTTTTTVPSFCPKRHVSPGPPVSGSAGFR